VTEPTFEPSAGLDPPPALRLRDPGLLFDAREARLRALAAGHPAPEWLLLLSRVAGGQARAVRELGPGRVRAPEGGPPLAFDRLPRDDAWRRMLEVVVSASAAPGLPLATRDALHLLGTADAARLEALAGDVLAGRTPPDRLACAPFVGAALQAWLAALSASIDPTRAPPARGACPLCGGPPVAATVQGDRLRYVTCALCAAEWNVPRVRCVLCDSGGGLDYLHLDGDPGAKAEACGACRAYVKLFDQEKRPGADAAADDAATIALDLLLAEEGWRRAGVNLYVGAVEAPGATA
jgi:FdhE protein